jgi:hypothetical protein
MGRTRRVFEIAQHFERFQVSHAHDEVWTPSTCKTKLDPDLTMQSRQKIRIHWGLNLEVAGHPKVRQIHQHYVQ